MINFTDGFDYELRETAGQTDNLDESRRRGPSFQILRYLPLQRRDKLYILVMNTGRNGCRKEYRNENRVIPRIRSHDVID